jgi:hypothetical protein
MPSPGTITPAYRHVLSDISRYGIQCIFAPTRNEHVIHAFLNESLRGGEAHARRASGDNRNLARKFL